MVTEFYTKIFELKGVEEFSRDKEISLTDGKVRLLIRPCNENLYRGMRQGLDHIGFQVENVVAGKTWQYRHRISTISAEKTWRRQAGVLIQRDLQACPIGKHAFADPDGVLMDMTD